MDPLKPKVATTAAPVIATTACSVIETAAAVATPCQRVSGITIRPATLEDVDAAAAVYAEAFKSDPEMLYIYKGTKAARYKTAVQTLYLKGTRAMFCRPGSLSWCALDLRTGKLVGAADIMTFDHYPSLLQFATSGLLFGSQWPSLNCLFRALQTSDAEAVAARHKHLGIAAEVHMIGVAPQYQGRGIGTQLLRALLRQWDAGYCGALILYTAKEWAVQVYQRHGFKVLEVRELDGGKLKIWYMYRPASTGSSTEA